MSIVLLFRTEDPVGVVAISSAIAPPQRPVERLHSSTWEVGICAVVPVRVEERFQRARHTLRRTLEALRVRLGEVIVQRWDVQEALQHGSAVAEVVRIVQPRGSGLCNAYRGDGGAALARTLGDAAGLR